MAYSILVLNGPNLNLLGTREPDIYGNLTLEEINLAISAIAESLEVSVEFAQSNSEGKIIDILQGASSKHDAVILNPGAYTHYSIAIRDSVAGIEIPVVETHLSNVSAREEFRHTSVISAVCLGVVSGFGKDSYLMALEGLVSHLNQIAAQ